MLKKHLTKLQKTKEIFYLAQKKKGEEKNLYLFFYETENSTK